LLCGGHVTWAVPVSLAGSACPIPPVRPWAECPELEAPPMDIRGAVDVTAADEATAEDGSESGVTAGSVNC
jgi:hypothetical protein